MHRRARCRASRCGTARCKGLLGLRLVFWCHASLGWCLLALTFTKFSNTVFTGGVFRRSTFGFFQRIVVRGGTFGAFAWVCS